MEEPSEYPTEGRPEGPQATAQTPISNCIDVRTVRYAICSQNILSITVCSLCIVFIAIQQPDVSTPFSIAFALFACIFSIITWLYICVFSETIDNERIQKYSPHILLIVNLFFSIGAAIAITLALRPSGSCSDNIYVYYNGLADGSPANCRLGQACCVFLWVGMLNSLLTADTTSLYHKRGVWGIQMEGGQGSTTRR